MIYESNKMEEQAILQTAAKMCAAARTAPKAKGKDSVVTLVLTGQEKDILADKMDEIGKREFGEKSAEWFGRDAKNLRSAQAVVLIGVKRCYRGVQHCGFCGFENCGDCKAHGGTCAVIHVDLGIALSSAVLAAANEHVDNRIMFSIGKAAMEMEYCSDVVWQGIPLSISGKNIFFGRL